MPCVPKLLAPDGVFYLVVTKENKPGNEIFLYYSLNNAICMNIGQAKFAVRSLVAASKLKLFCQEKLTMNSSLFLSL